MGLTRKDLAEKRVFLETMRGAPFDVEIRSVYADWLESHGDAKMADLNRILIWVLGESKRTLPPGVPAWKSGREILFPFLPAWNIGLKVPALVYRTNLNIKKIQNDYYGPGWHMIFRPKWDKLHQRHDWIRVPRRIAIPQLVTEARGGRRLTAYWRLDGSFW